MACRTRPGRASPNSVAEAAEPLARPGGALRLCPCALDEPPPADDPLGRDADARRAAGSCSKPRGSCSSGTAMPRSGSTISPGPKTGWPRAQAAGTLRRNFQGYTDDAAPVLIGLGASSISRFPQGYAQNASGTADHTKAIRAGQFSTHRGHALSGEDLLRARIIEALMCDFRVSRAELLRDYDTTPARLEALFAGGRPRLRRHGPAGHARRARASRPGPAADADDRAGLRRLRHRGEASAAI